MTRFNAIALAATVTLAALSGAANAQFTGTASELPNAADRYATAQPATSGLTRAEVRAAIEQARHDGMLVTDFVTGKPIFAVDASVAQRQVADSGRSRAEVKAEVAQAQRDGTLVVSDITGRPFYGVANRTSGRGTGAE